MMRGKDFERVVEETYHGAVKKKEILRGMKDQKKKKSFGMLAGMINIT